jgi:hypothetical protein
MGEVMWGGRGGQRLRMQRSMTAWILQLEEPSIPRENQRN